MSEGSYVGHGSVSVKFISVRLEVHYRATEQGSVCHKTELNGSLSAEVCAPYRSANTLQAVLCFAWMSWHLHHLCSEPRYGVIDACSIVNFVCTLSAPCNVEARAC